VSRTRRTDWEDCPGLSPSTHSHDHDKSLVQSCWLETALYLDCYVIPNFWSNYACQDSHRFHSVFAGGQRLKISGAQQTQPPMRPPAPYAYRT